MSRELKIKHLGYLGLNVSDLFLDPLAANKFHHQHRHLCLAYFIVRLYCNLGNLENIIVDLWADFSHIQVVGCCES